MNLEPLRAILSTRFKDNWKTGAAEYLPTEYENVAFIQPEGAPWARFSIVFGDVGEASLGMTHSRVVGVIYIQVFTKPGAGSKPFTDARDKAAGFFENWQYNGGGWDVEVRRARLDTTGSNKDGKWYQKNISIAFRADLTE